MRTVSIGCQSFQFLREHDLFYIDKTPFLSKWYRGMDIVTLITRPRRFGKTLTQDMMRCFFSTEYHGKQELFSGLKIESDEELMKLQGTVPVIYLSFADEHPTNMYDFVGMLVTRIAELYSDHRNIMDDNRFSHQEKKTFQILETIPDVLPEPVLKNGELNRMYSSLVRRLAESVHNLSKWMERYYGRKVFVLLDEYDTPLQSAYLNGYWDEAVTLMREFFGKTFKTNSAMERAIITGTTRIAKESLFSEMNHLTISSVRNGFYEDVFGFTQTEVDDALSEFEITDKKEDVKYWYDGFTMGNVKEIYNPWSICNYLNDPQHRLISYWAQSGGIALVDRLFRMGSQDLLMMLRQLILGESIKVSIKEELRFPELDQDPAAVWSLLLAAGYVKIATESETTSLKIPSDEYVLTLTNQEMKEAFADMSKRWLKGNQVNYVNHFTEAMLKNDIQQMNETLREIVLICVSSFDLGNHPTKKARSIQPEKYFQGLMTGLVASLMSKFSISSNEESGYGRYDLQLEPLCVDDDAYIFEFKVFDKKSDKSIQDTTQRAVRQISEKAYDTRLRAKNIFADKIHKYGIGFKGKDVLICKA